MTRFQKLTVLTAAATIVLFALGGVVRGTGSGLGCSTWPHCEPGQFLPSGTPASIIEFSHRALAGVVAVLIGACALFAWRRRHAEPEVFNAAALGVPLVFAQAVLGGIVVHTELSPSWVTVHFALAMALVADVVILAIGALTGRPGSYGRSGFPRTTGLVVLAVGALLLAGTHVRATGTGLAFTDWPLMDGRLIPTLGATTFPTFLHRILAVVALLLLIWTLIRSRTLREARTPVTTLALVACILYLAQIFVGAAQIWTRLSVAAVTAHVALSVFIWAVVVALWATAARLVPDPEPSGADDGPAREKPSLRDTAAAYLQLTKPRIIVLLLITTVPAMVLAAGRLPPLWLVAATLVGGALAAGAANAMNCYLDRDIDARMRRTRTRPLPTHRLTPERALAFGYVLAAISFFFLAVTVNVLAAALSSAAIAFYIFVYTLWLKRSHEQNIVIGGAAGAVPALVGWAAVTGELELPAIVLFLIVFVWTPAHFWALAMRFRDDYHAAGVPMLPVVRSREHTLLQIVLYATATFASSLVLIPVAGMGPLYTVAAVALGGAFTYRALHLRNHYSQDGAWRLFKFSVAYLAALFLAVALDRLVAAPV